MKKQLLIATAATTALVTYFLLRKKYANPNKLLQFKSNPNHDKHHLTKVFAKAKKHAVS